MVEVTRGRSSEAPAGSAFVQFADVFGAEAARCELDGRLVSGIRISVSGARDARNVAT
jgi:hypothetical protein